MKATALAASLACVLGVFVQPALAGSVAGFGGATEVTQLMNNAQLGASYLQEVETALNSARQYKLMIDQLRRNPAGFATRMLDSDIQRHLANADSAVEMVDRLTSLRDNTRRVYDELDRSGRTIETMNGQGYEVTPSEYLGMVSQLAKDKRGYWDERVEDFRDSAARAQDDIDSVNRIVEEAEGIETEIDGLQNVVSSNAVISRQLAGLTLAINEQMSVIASEKAEEADARLREAEALKRFVEQHNSRVEAARRGGDMESQ